MKKHSTGQAPYGFRWVENKLVALRGESDTRRIVFELFLEHRNLSAVARILNERGTRTRRGGPWRDAVISRLLKCSSAKGVYAVNKTTVGESGERVERPESEWKHIETEQIVTDELWDRVQEILAGRTETRSRFDGDKNLPYSGILKCTCGRKLIFQSSGSRYICGECRTEIPIDDLDEIFRVQLARLIFDRPDLFGSSTPESEAAENQEERLSELRSRLREVKASMSNFESLHAKGKISLERFEEVHAPLENERAMLSEEIRQLNSVIKKQREAVPMHEEPEPGNELFFLVERWDSLPVNDQRALIRSLIDHITIGDGELEIAYAFPDKIEDSSIDESGPQQTESPTNEPPFDPNEPVYVRLPKPGQRCPLTGMSRSKLNQLILANDRNHHNPPVASFLDGRTRLIVWRSLKKYLADQERKS